MEKDSLFYENFVAQNGKTPKEVKKNIKLSSDELNEIANVFNNEFLCEKKSKKGEVYVYSHINFGKASFEIPLNSKIQNYFFVDLKKRLEL